MQTTRISLSGVSLSTWRNWAKEPVSCCITPLQGWTVNADKHINIWEHYREREKHASAERKHPCEKEVYSLPYWNREEMWRMCTQLVLSCSDRKNHY